MLLSERWVFCTLRLVRMIWLQISSSRMLCMTRVSLISAQLLGCTVLRHRVDHCPIERFSH
jgi:hypothetical protein